MNTHSALASRSASVKSSRGSVGGVKWRGGRTRGKMSIHKSNLKLPLWELGEVEG